MRKKKMIQKCVLASIICTIMFLFPFLVKDLDEDSSFSYSKMDVTCIVNKDGSISLKEEFTLDTDDKNTYLRDIIYSKDTRANYQNNNHGKLDLSSLKITVNDPVAGILSASYYNQLNPNLANDSDNIIAFSGSYDELGNKISCVGSDSYCQSLVVYLENGIHDNTTYTLEYTILDAVNVFSDVAELNWKLVPSLDAKKKNVSLNVYLPSNNYSLANNNVGDIHYYGFGGNNSSFIEDEMSNTKLVAKAKSLSSIEEMEILCYFPSDMISPTGTNNVFSYKGENLIQSRIEDVLKKEEAYASKHNSLAINLGISSSLIVIGMIGLFIFTYFKYDKEHTSDFASDYYRELPANYPPAVMGYLYNEELLSSDDLNATLLDLIRRKYIIVDQNGCSLDDKKPNYKLIYNRGKEKVGIAQHEQFLLNWFFDTISGGKNELTLDEIDDYVKIEANAINYDKCNKRWNEYAISEAKRYDFFEKLNLKKGIISIIFLITLINGLFCFDAIFTWSVDYLIVFLILTILLFINYLIYSSEIRRRTVRGNEDYIRWKAFKNFLIDFSTFEDYPLPSIVVWEHYLVYATSFGIADQVEKQLRMRYKELGREIEFETSMYYHPYYYRYMTRRIAYSSMISRQTIMASEAKRMSSSGGRRGGFGGGSSFGGGGGRSGVR